jgi:ABC-type oligopeptide transport system ATPase subunit
MPSLGAGAHEDGSRVTPILEARDLRKHYGLRHTVPAVDGVSFTVERG